MRHAIYTTTDGKIWLWQVLLFSLLQGLLCSGKVLLSPQRGSPHQIWLLRDPHPPQEDGPKMATATPTTAKEASTTSAVPILRELGFLPRQRHRRPGGVDPANVNPISVNFTRESNSSLDYEIWKALLSRAEHNLSSSSAPTSQLPVPHLDRFGFGVSSKLGKLGKISRTGHSLPGDKVESKEHVTDTDLKRQDLRQLVMLGLGSFIGGISVILCILFVVVYRKRCRNNSVSPENVEAREDDPKTTLISNEASPPVINSTSESTNEYSTSSSTSSNSLETSSNTSDNGSHSSEYGDVWLAPDQIALSTLNQPPGRDSAAQIYDQFVVNSNIQSVRQHRVVDPVPDLLLGNSVTDYNLHHHPDQEYVSEEGGIIIPEMSEAVLIVPPGAVTSPVGMALKVHHPHDYHQIRNSPEEQIISPIVELSTPTEDVEFFANALTMKLPYRSLPCSSTCSCEDDPLCDCTGSRVELRYCDISTADSCQWRRAQSPAVGGSYVWPECFSPEDVQHRHREDFGHILASRLQQRQSIVSYKCSDSVCEIKTNVSGLYGLVWVPAKRHASWTEYSEVSEVPAPSRRGSLVQMCATVSSRLEKVQRRSIGNQNCPEIVYTVHITDNTSDSKQRLSSDIHRSGGRQASTFIPLDIRSSSVVTVCLASVLNTDWGCTLPRGAKHKETVPWSAFCKDFGSVATVDFRCSPKTDEVRTTVAEVLTAFDIEVAESCRNETRLCTKRLRAVTSMF